MRCSDRLPDDVPESIAADAALKALWAAVGVVDAARRQEAAAAGWNAKRIVRLVCATFGDSIAAVRVSESNFIVITAEFSGDDLFETHIAVGPEGTCACKMSVGETHLGYMALDVQSFERVQKDRLGETRERGLALSLSCNPTRSTPLGFTAKVARPGSERGRGAVGPRDDGGDGAGRPRVG